MPRLLPALILVLAALAAAPAAALADCPGGTPACPYTAASQIGQRAGGVLRFPQAVAIGADGNIYVGDQGSHIVQVFSPFGGFLHEVGKPGTRPGELTGVGALAAAPDGSLLVADGANRIARFAADGSFMTEWGGSGSKPGQFRFGGGRGNDAGAGGGLAVGGTMVYAADSGNDRIQRFALDGSQGAVIVPPGTLAHPKGLAVRGSRLFVADDQHHRVLVMDTGGKLLKTIGDGGGTKPGQLNYPYGVATDPSGRVFVADNLNQRIVRFSGGPAYPYKGRWGSYGTGPGELAYPRGIAADGSGSVYVANTGNDRIDVFDKAGNRLRSFGTSGRGKGQFNTPMGVAADASGVRAVTDSVNGRIELLNPDGSVASSWGSPAPGPTVLPRTVAVAFDSGGTLYALDQRRARIVVFWRGTGGPARTIGSQGRGPDNLLDPSAIAISGGGTIYVADTGNQRIARFSTSGDYLGAWTAAGAVRGIAVSPDGSRIYASDAENAITVYSAEGEPLDTFGGTGSKLGKLNAPAQMTVDPTGNLWVADRGNNRIQEFGPNGERIAAFGERGTGVGQFIYPTAVSVDCRGVLTVTDSYNNRVQQFTMAGGALSACGALPALGSPPPVQLPTLPAPDGPQVSLRALRRTGVLSSRQVPIRVGCDTLCTVSATLTLTPRAQPKKGKKRVAVTAGGKTKIGAGESSIVRLRFSREKAKKLRTALRGGRGLNASITVTATAAVGSPTTVSSQVKVRG